MTENEAKPTWGKAGRDLPERWPRQADGTPEQGVFLTHRMEWNCEVELLERMLRDYGIPVRAERGHYGSLGRVVMGFSGEGVDLYVPASKLEDARDLLEPVDGTELDKQASKL